MSTGKTMYCRVQQTWFSGKHVSQWAEWQQDVTGYEGVFSYGFRLWCKENTMLQMKCLIEGCIWFRRVCSISSSHISRSRFHYFWPKQHSILVTPFYSLLYSLCYVSVSCMCCCLRTSASQSDWSSFKGHGPVTRAQPPHTPSYWSLTVWPLCLL